MQGKVEGKGKGERMGKRMKGRFLEEMERKPFTASSSLKARSVLILPGS
jgi:hypothetical protein